MKSVKFVVIIISTLLLSLGCDKSINTSNEEGATLSTNAQSEKPSSYSQVLDKNALECLLDDSASINVYYNHNLKELEINDYSTFILENIDEVETSEGRPHEFTRMYKNDQGHTAILMSQNFIRNLELTDAKGQTTSYSFNSGLECDTLPSTNHLTYQVIVDRAFIYKQPDLDSKTSSYFIAGDEIEVLSTKDSWVKTSYLKGSKTGWLRLKDLEEKSGLDASVNEITNSKLQDEFEKIQSGNSIDSDQKKYVIDQKGVGEIFLGQAFNSNKFEELEAQLEGVDNCSLTTSNEYPKYQHSLYFQFFDNVLTGVSISSLGSPDEIPFRSYTGVKIGDTIKTVMKLHNKQPDETLNSPHTDDPIFIYWTDSSKKTGMRYDTVNGEVSSMSLKYNPHIRYFEGCG